MPLRPAVSAAQVAAAAHELGYPDRPVCFKPVFSSGSRGFRVLDPTVDRAHQLLLLLSQVAKGIGGLRRPCRILIGCPQCSIEPLQIEPGQTLAIGGLIQNTITATSKKVPFLGDIPFLGVASPIAFLIMPPIQTEEETKPNAVQLAAQQAKEEPKPEEKKGFALGKNKAKAAPAAAAAGLPRNDRRPGQAPRRCVRRQHFRRRRAEEDGGGVA